jgi:hypothetical protein
MMYKNNGENAVCDTPAMQKIMEDAGFSETPFSKVASVLENSPRTESAEPTAAEAEEAEPVKKRNYRS